MCYYVHVFFCPGACECCVEVEPRLQTNLCWVPWVTCPEQCWNFKPAKTRLWPWGLECEACKKSREDREIQEIVDFANSIGWVTKSGKQ